MTETSKKPLGVLILHGFTGSLDTVRALVPMAEELGLPYRMPVLRGHGTRVEDLQAATPAQWEADAQSALDDLLGECEKAVIVGLSMGGLVTLNLARRNSDRLVGIVLIATFLRCANPLSHLTPLIKLFFPFWPNPTSFADRERAKACTNYTKLPTHAFSRLLNYGNETERHLGEVRVPALIVHARKDSVAHPIGAKLLEERLGSPSKQVVWFERSDHEMLQDLEADAVVAAVGRFIGGFLQAQAS